MSRNVRCFFLFLFIFNAKRKTMPNRFYSYHTDVIDTVHELTAARSRVIRTCGKTYSDAADFDGRQAWPHGRKSNRNNTVSTFGSFKNNACVFLSDVGSCTTVARTATTVDITPYGNVCMLKFPFGCRRFIRDPCARRFDNQFIFNNVIKT